MNEIYPGVTCEWLHDNRIVVYTLHSPRTRVLAEWSRAALDVLKAWPQDRPYLAVHDISQSGIGMLYCAAVKDDIFNIGVIPEARRQVETILAARPGSQAGLAVVLASSLSGHLSRLVLKPGAGDGRIQAKAFFYRDKAVEALLSLETAAGS